MNIVPFLAVPSFMLVFMGASLRQEYIKRFSTPDSHASTRLAVSHAHKGRTLASRMTLGELCIFFCCMMCKSATAILRRPE